MSSDYSASNSKDSPSLDNFTHEPKDQIDVQDCNLDKEDFECSSQCGICGMVFGNANLLDEHVRDHQRIWTADKFATPQSLSNEILDSHPAKRPRQVLFSEMKRF